MCVALLAVVSRCRLLKMSLSPKSVFITGSNRGIGLEFVKEFLALPVPPKHVIATCRNPQNAKELQDLAKDNPSLTVMKLDVTDHTALAGIVEATQQLLEAEGLNLLINNAAIIDRATLEETTTQSMRDNFEINAVAPLKITQELLPLLRQAAKASPQSGMSCSKSAIINMGSKVGSMADNGSGGRYPYRISKAAVNMLTKNLAVDLAKEDILSAVLHPGWVQTEMGGPNALIDTQTCVQGLLNVMAGLDQSKTGTFWDYKGMEVPW